LVASASVVGSLFCDPLRLVSQSRKEHQSGKAVVSSPFVFMYFRSATRRRFPLQFDLIVINGGSDEIF
jgi:hypothetical protein